MSIIYTNTKAKKVKKSPGWRHTQEEYAAWLKRVQTETLSGRAAKAVKASESRDLNNYLAVPRRQVRKIDSLIGTGKAICGKSVSIPEVMYKGDEEKIQREKLAREETDSKKLRTAPVYNKGGNVYMTDDMIDDMKSGSLRRRS